MTNIERCFADSNVLLYLLLTQHSKAETARRLIDDGLFISAQVLNELVSVMRKKYRLPWEVVRENINFVRDFCPVVSVTLETHELALEIAEQTGIRIYDANIVAAAELASCDTLYTEDLNDGQRIGRVTIRNPFM